MSEGVRFFGIRHHGPGCARSLRAALAQWQPDCVLIEGPAGAEPLLAHVLEADMQPPVALLSHAVDEPQLAVFHPYAVYSPEWQAMTWAAQAGVPQAMAWRSSSQSGASASPAGIVAMRPATRSAMRAASIALAACRATFCTSSRSRSVTGGPGWRLSA